MYICTAIAREKKGRFANPLSATASGHTIPRSLGVHLTLLASPSIAVHKFLLFLLCHFLAQKMTVILCVDQVPREHLIVSYLIFKGHVLPNGLKPIRKTARAFYPSRCLKSRIWLLPIFPRIYGYQKRGRKSD